MKPIAKFEKLTAFKKLSALIIIIVAFISCDKGNLPPVAKLVAFPAAGDTTVLFDFSAEGSADDRNYPIGLVFRWDFNGDGIWDTEYSKTNAIAHKYRVSGKYEVKVDVKDIDGLTSIATDSIEVYAYNQDIDTLTDPRDGNRYRIVKIKDRWWMAENLRYGTEIPTDREQTDNDTVEFYRNPYSKYKYVDSIGGVYLWYESMNYRRENPQGICPDGWHIPAKTEWESLFTGGKQGIGGYYYYDLYSVQYYRENGPSNLNLDLSNEAERWKDGFFAWSYQFGGGFWSSDSRYITDPPYFVYYPYECYFNSLTLHISVGCWVNLPSNDHTPLTSYLSVRCIKDN
jgi:uncharacterized protein (TIGR02145 family)